MMFLFMDYTLCSAQASSPVLTAFATTSSTMCFVFNTYSPGFCKEVDYKVDPGLSLCVTLLSSQMMLEWVMECEAFKLS